MQDFKQLHALINTSDMFANSVVHAIKRTVAEKADLHYTVEARGCEAFSSNEFRRCPPKGMKMHSTYVGQQGAMGHLSHVKITFVCPMWSIADTQYDFVVLGKERGNVDGGDTNILNAMRVAKLDYRGAHLPVDNFDSYMARKEITGKLDDYFYDLYKCLSGTSHYRTKPIFDNRGFTGIVATVLIGKPVILKKL